MASMWQNAKSGLAEAAKDLGNEAFQDIGNTYQRFLWQDTSRVLPGQFRSPETAVEAPAHETPPTPEAAAAPETQDPDFDR